jgi:hypothetical protein|tara:strand:- start:7108 stop:7371 length:264 start_codon:yes stop_codon:yes gene_type:complete
MKNHLKIMLLYFCVQGCDIQMSDAECTDCGGGLINGFLYKEITIDDIGSLAELNIAGEIGKCIRFKLDGENFSEAMTVDDCCCVEYQ